MLNLVEYNRCPIKYDRKAIKAEGERQSLHFAIIYNIKREIICLGGEYTCQGEDIIVSKNSDHVISYEKATEELRYDQDMSDLDF